MSRPHPKTKSAARADDLNAVLSLRWLLAILASYLTLFSYLGSEMFPIVSGVAIAFSLTNVGLMVVPRHLFESKVHKVIAAFDVLFISATLYLLRVPENHLYIGFIVIFVLAVVWRDLRVVRFSLFVVSLLYGVFRYFRLFQSQLEVNLERFLALSLFFVVSIFYIFLSDLLRREAKRANTIVEENRIAEVMVEMSRALSSSLNSGEVLYSIVSRLRGALDAEDCSIVRIDPKTVIAKVMVKASRPDERNTDINLEDAPELQEAYMTRRILYRPEGNPHGLIVIPMIAEGLVLGLIDIRSPKLNPAVAAANTRFFEITASTAANALRNAQLFEEVEHRARTDFLTGLANHRFFQTALSGELVRAQRHKHSLSLLIIDLDFLKEVNDRFGHPSGDMVIKAIAETIRSTLREIDFAARYGGEEFTVILPETSLMDAVQVADRIRERIAAQQFPGVGGITASIGLSNYPVNALTKEDLIRVADQALYVAKNGGRDRVAYFNYQMITR
jgi:diguanylate cyclase (GGDEF)-like protein